MMNSGLETGTTLKQLIAQELKPYVKRIDAEAFYAEDFLKKIGQAGWLSSDGKSQEDLLLDEMELVESVAKVCMTTAFCLWCHLAALTYLRNTSNDVLQKKLLPALENGQILGATGLSNPMKHIAGLEKLYLQAEPADGGYTVSGVLSSVSNLGQNHWMGIIANVEGKQPIMCFIPCEAKGVSLKEKVGYLAVNGSATYACSFSNVFIPDEWIVAEDADSYVEKIRPAFLSYQIPLGFGVTQASIESIEKVHNKQNGCNRYLKTQSNELQQKYAVLKDKIRRLVKQEKVNWKDIAGLRLESVYLTLDAVQASMLHNGSAGYIQDSAPSRRLREAYFFANLTPTVKHLEKILQGQS
ncbi:acyl-CoA dehydrogenase family protein [Paenisporosarcina antarctica]|uniref:Acyl-CoA dehydrogenase n=1 Tax=Paenisporosarcina antarctica TaxID=417367 RepID=A0A4P6ZZK7_9BACL|nr:acyl-CoA dehydrogenase family protein [Paenisporosarcina antarctica]QBP40996.1 acyl-CoA dehydrogenase [Paenisporosarcina antarctica]